MKIIFFGTPEFAAQVLAYLLDKEINVVAIVTQPDRPKGRLLQVAPSPVKQCIIDRGLNIPVLQPQKASESAFLHQLAALNADLFVVVAFGQILPQSLLEIPSKGCINVHTSLLPKYRGAAPMQRCLMNGDAETGVCVQKIVKQLDAGDVIATAKLEIAPDMVFGTLEDELCALSKSLLLFVLQKYEKGIPHAEPQDHSLATYAAKTTAQDREIQWGKSAVEIHNLVRAFAPSPGAWTWACFGKEKKRIKILRSTVVHQRGEPGKFLKDGIVGCGSDALKIIEVQPEGKKAMKISDWLRGFKELPYFEECKI